jgi:hypothetical protein
MQIHIEEEKTLAAIKGEFSTLFPQLKIEFYAEQHKAGEGTPARLQLDENLTITQARTAHNEGALQINGDQKTSTLEAAFESMYGLHAQVFRKSGDGWLQTTATDHWTLSQQNQHNQA